jgi:hypothetical protein
MALTQLPQFPCPPGNKNHSIGAFTGPASYTQITTGSPPTGGLQVTAAQMGMTSIEFMECSVDGTGTYKALVIFPNNFTLTRDVPYVIVMFVVAATGAQVAGAVDLSGFTFRYHAHGI